MQHSMPGFAILGAAFGQVPVESSDPARRVVVRPYEIHTIMARLTEDLTDPLKSAKAAVLLSSFTLGGDFDADADTDLDYSTDSGVHCRVFGGPFMGSSVALLENTIVLAHRMIGSGRFVIASTDVCGVSHTSGSGGS
jgi:hypothetical protein